MQQVVSDTIKTFKSIPNIVILCKIQRDMMKFVHIYQMFLQQVSTQEPSMANPQFGVISNYTMSLARLSTGVIIFLSQITPAP